MKRKKIVILLFFLFSIISCHIYTPSEIIEKGYKVKESHKEQLKKLIEYTNKLAKDECMMYSIYTSPKTELFEFSVYYYDKKENKFIESFLDINNKSKNFIQSNLPKKYITDVLFTKDIYAAFDFRHTRDKEYRYAKLIYCHNKEFFKKLFINYTYYEKNQINDINDTCNWVYFYDDHWAITTSSVVFKLTEEECKNLIK